MAAEDKNSNFKVPDGYFDKLALNIQSTVFIENLKEKQLNAGFTLPQNYFENLKYKLATTGKINQQPLAKSKTKIFKLNLIKYAAAACILIVCGFAVFINLGKNTIQKQLANLPNEDIELYLQNNTNNTDLPLIIQNVNEIKVEVDKKISTQELNDYLNQTI
ncbi:MAG: hypothetical protein EAZ15_09335 [Sphingobacteriales bacterium]|nr:MAG: hypothetical protein EAZ15_09335 [Sphingobacteriales bacterium]